jgi:hypothetical protein
MQPRARADRFSAEDCKSLSSLAEAACGNHFEMSLEAQSQSVSQAVRDGAWDGGAQTV